MKSSSTRNYRGLETRLEKLEKSSNETLIEKRFKE